MWNRVRSRLLEQGLILIAFTIPVSQFFSIRLILTVCIISFFKTDFSSSLSRWLRNSWDIGIYVLILLLGLLYTAQLDVGLRVLETSFSLLGISFILAHNPSLNQRHFYKIVGAFALGVLVSALICMTSAFVQFYNGSTVSVFFFDRFTDIINIQPTYFAYYLSFVLTLCLYFLYYEKFNLRYEFIVLVLLLFFLFGVLMLTGARTSYVAMILVFSFFILKFLFEEDRIFLKKLVFMLSLFLLIAMLGINHFDFNGASISLESDYWERLSLWKSAIDANPSFLFGVGTGDYKEVMNEYYVTHNLSHFAPESFNAHNEFLQRFFSNGLIGLITILILIGRPLYLSVKYQNVLGILVFFSFIIYGMTEVFLGRYQGVVFFAFLHQVFIHFYYGRQPTFSLKVV